MAIENKYSLTANIKSKFYGGMVPKVTANDNIIFEIQLYDDTVLFPLLGTYRYTLVTYKKNKTSVIREGSLVGSLIVFNLGASETTESGRVEATVQIYDTNNKRISAAPIAFEVIKDPSLQGSLPADDKTLVIANESLLTEAIEQASTANARIDTIVATAGDSNTEIVDARGGKASLGARLNETDTQLAQISANVKSFGAKGDGVTDDTQSIRNAISALSGGGILYFPPGQYLVSKIDTNNYIFKIDRPIKIKGAGFVSTIRIKTGTPTTCDLFYISPNMAYGGEFYGIEDLLIFPQTNTDGRHAFHFDVSASGQYMSKFYMSDVYIQQHGGKAIQVTNAEDKADGFFGSTFERCVFYGGVDLERAGDSIVFRDCTFTGKGRGFRAKLVSITASGIYASQLLLENPNITSEGGAILIEFAKNVTIIGGNIEQTVAFSGHVVDISGNTNEVVNVTIERNHIGVFGFTGAIANNVRVDNVNGAIIDKCTFENEVSGTNILIDSAAENVFVGENRFGNGVHVVDNGLGTSGVLKTPTLLNSWVNFNSTYYNQAGYYKDRDGYVHLKGLIKDGVTTAGTTLFTLPVGYRPKLITPFFLITDNLGTLVNSDIRVLDTGEVVAQANVGVSRVSLDGLKFLAEQ